MDRNGLVLGISAVLFGITVVMLIAGLAVNPFFLLAILPFGGSAYLLWFQATGRLEERVRQQTAAGGQGTQRERVRQGQRGFDPGAFGAGVSGDGFERERRRRAAQGAGRGRGTDRRRPPNANGSTLSPSEAREILGVDATADEEAIKTAYRQKVKRHHPDTASGDEETFKKVSRAYETLSE